MAVPVRCNCVVAIFFVLYLTAARSEEAASPARSEEAATPPFNGKTGDVWLLCIIHAPYEDLCYETLSPYEGTMDGIVDISTKALLIADEAVHKELARLEEEISTRGGPLSETEESVAKYCIEALNPTSYSMGIAIEIRNKILHNNTAISDKEYDYLANSTRTWMGHAMDDVDGSDCALAVKNKPVGDRFKSMFLNSTDVIPRLVANAYNLIFFPDLDRK